MTRFNSVAEADQVIGGFLRELPRLDPLIREIVQHNPLVMKLELSDPPLDAELDLTCTPLAVRMDSSASGAVGLAGSCSDFLRVLLGQLPVAVGINRKKLLVRGSTAKMMKVVSLFYMVPYIYPSYLESIGRADLLEPGERPPLHGERPLEGTMNKIISALAYLAGYGLGLLKRNLTPRLDILAALEAMGQGLSRAAGQPKPEPAAASGAEIK
jgi:hypothetical protein